MFELYTFSIGFVRGSTHMFDRTHAHTRMFNAGLVAH